VQESYNSFRFALSGAVRRLVILSVALTALSGCASLGRAQDKGADWVKVQYDEQKDVTQITLNPFVLASRKLEELRLGVMASYKGRVRAQPKEVVLLFLSLSAADADKYETARRLTVLADGRTLGGGNVQRSKQTQNGLFVEALAAVVPFDTFQRICQAKEVTLKLGITEVKLSPAQIALLGIAADYMRPPANQ
jgi:hypothetical protein